MNAYILGAGFSKAVCRHMPLVDDLLDGLRHEVGEHRPELMADQQLPIENVEEFLDFLATPQPFLEPHENLENKALFGRLANWLRFRIYDAQRETQTRCEPPDWLTRLVSAWHREKVTAVTLNYDTLVEATVHALEIRSGDETILTRDLYPMPIPSADARLWAMLVLERMPVPSFQLVKLHGSLNWFYSGAAGYGQPIVDVGIAPWNGDPPVAWEQVRARAPKYEALIVPPSLVKTAYFEHEIAPGNPVA